jgi:nucleotide-binding universal stress UspA family protein
MVTVMTTETTTPPEGLRLRHVLVPLDGSEFSLRALPTARSLAERLGADVHTISAVAADEDADRRRALTSAALGVDVGDERAAVVPGHEPSAAIARRADDLGSCVVCLSTHGRGRLSGALVGSVARSLLQRSPDPIVALGPMADNPGWTPRPRRWPEPLTVPRIVACVDGSGPSEQVLPISAAWASALGMSMTILTVADDVLPTERSEASEVRYGSHPDAERYIDDLVERWSHIVPDVDGEVVRDPIGPPGGIRDHLARRPAGLVAVTTHARDRMERARLGAAAAGIVHASTAPCLVAPVRTGAQP